MPLSALTQALVSGQSPATARRLPTLGDSFPDQWAYITSQALFNAVCCSRRAGKTNGAIPRAILVLSKPGTWVHYVSLIRRNARKQFWRPLLLYLERLGWKEGDDYTKNEVEMIVTTSWGSYLQATSCDDISGIKAIKGDRSDLFLIDECQEPNDDVITALVDIAATPMLTDTGGMLDLLGTPPEAEPCFFSKALDNQGWQRFHWTQFDHDYPRSRELKWARVKEICSKRGLPIAVDESVNDNGRLVLTVKDGTHPIVQREYFGIRKQDPTKVAYEYVEGRNDYDPHTVDFAKGKWSHSYGLDLGFQDRDAIVVLAWRRDDPDRRLYVRFQWQRNHNDVDMLAPVVKAVHRVYRPVGQVGDHGGHGAVKVLETLASRLGIVYDRKPPDVMVSVGFVNDDLRTGRLLFPVADVESELVIGAGADRKLIEDSEGTLSGEATRVMKSINSRTKKVEINKRGYHSDLTEALRYAHACARAYRAKAPPKAMTLDDERDRREQEREAAASSGEF